MIIIKLSGKALNDEEALSYLFSKIQNQKVVIVHGGGKELDELLSALNLKTTKLSGIRVSPQEQMPYITGCLAGTCNKHLQSQAIKHKLNAIGMLCTDYQICSLQPYPSEYGFVAHCSANEVKMLNHLLDYGYVPVISSIGINEQGQQYNINADEVATALAIALKSPLIFLSDVKGVLDNQGQVIEHLDAKTINALLEQGVITEGMAVKVRNALAVSEQSQNPVFIASIFDRDALDRLSSLRRIGTSISQ